MVRKRKNRSSWPTSEEEGANATQTLYNFATTHNSPDPSTADSRGLVEAVCDGANTSAKHMGTETQGLEGSCIVNADAFQG